MRLAGKAPVADGGAEPHPSRLARDLTERFGGQAYAAEDLVAELGAAFELAALRLPAEPLEDHVRYVAPWLELQRGDRPAGGGQIPAA